MMAGLVKMKKSEKKILSRREFLKIAGVAGVGSIISPVDCLADASNKSNSIASGQTTVPRRPFGKTGINIPILSLGGGQNFLSNQLLLSQALKMGVTCWDTSRIYIGGKSEKGIGKYFSKHPKERKKVFLITKSGNTDPDDLTQHLYQSLQRMQTAYLDLFLIQAISNVKEDLNEAIKDWADRAKAQGKIRLFGFATHKNMETCLSEAAKLGWIDGIMTSYNYRLMHRTRMKEAVAACNEAGIGLIAMKTQASGIMRLFADFGKDSETALNLYEQFIQKDFTPEQAKLKAVWEDQSFASICSHMPNMNLLQANVFAALDKTELSSNDKQMLQQYARESAFGYCAGCAELCERAVKDTVPISDIMRYIMYYTSYAEYGQATELFNNLPDNTRQRLAHIDYSKAEHLCPQKMPIAQIMKKAVELFV
jgi:predicted aldo/keto reductase-like oxidoreductase